MTIIKAFTTALQFLTCLPIPSRTAPSESAVRLSLLFYPLVGLVIGSILAAVFYYLPNHSPLLNAAIVLAVWVAITGALHLDGLADSVDAWVGGYGDKERTLKIMKDPAIGPMGASALLVVALLKLTAISALSQQNWLLLIIIPMIARSQIILLAITTPYVRPQGLGSVLFSNTASIQSISVLFFVSAFSIFALGVLGFYLLLIALFVFLISRRAMVNRIGGTTGDTAGAVTELTETILIVVSPFLLHSVF